jgi:chemotaxis signal transduction protein
MAVDEVGERLQLAPEDILPPPSLLAGLFRAAFRWGEETALLLDPEQLSRYTFRLRSES